MNRLWLHCFFVLRILLRFYGNPKNTGWIIKQATVKRTVKSEQIAFGDAAELLGEDGIAAIKKHNGKF